MAIDSSIALGIQSPKFESPLNAFAQALQIRQMQNQGELADLQMQQTRQGIDETNRINRLYAEAMGADGKIDRQRLFQGAATQGLGSKIPSLQKQFAEADKESAALDKTRIEATAKRLDMAGQAFGFVRQNPTLENAHAALDYLQQTGVYSPEQVAQMKAQAAQNPNSIAQLADLAFRSAMNAKDQLPKIETRNLGGTTQTLAIDPVTLQQRIVSSAVNTQSPDSRARLAQEQQNANQGVTYQTDENGQIIALPNKLPPGAAVVGRPVMDSSGRPITSGAKPPTEFQGKSATFGARAEAADKTLTELTGKYSPSALNMKQGVGNIWAIGGGLEAGGNLLLSKEAQKAEQAMRDFINAVLRQESGAAIGIDEFDNAKRQYFPQPGDTKEVIEQKARNRKIAIEGFKRNAGRAAWSPDQAIPQTQQPIKLPGGFTFLGVEQK